MPPINLFAWSAGLAGIAFALLAALYIRSASRLTGWIDAQCPQLWSKVWRDSFAAAVNPSSEPYSWNKARRLDGIVIFNRAAGDYPDNPAFRALLSNCRWSGCFSLIAFTLAILLLGAATAPH